jgi:ADP-ribose pyrophosphatase
MMIPKQKIPTQAKLVFKGILHDTYQWQQELFDGTFATFEGLKRRDNTDILAITDDKKFIINYEEQPNRSPKICVPCGASEEGESLLDSAKRELVEETGYESDNWKDWFYCDVLNYGKMEWNTKYFIARNCKKTKEPHTDGGEKIEIKLYDFDKFIQVTQDSKFSCREIT